MFENRETISNHFLRTPNSGSFAVTWPTWRKPSVRFEAVEDRTGGTRFGGLPIWCGRFRRGLYANLADVHGNSLLPSGSPNAANQR